MTLKQALSQARESLVDNNVEDASLESEVLLRHVLGISRTQLYLDLSQELSPTHEVVFHRLIERRWQGEPSAYIIGHREFYGLDFHVDRNVLIPQLDREVLKSSPTAIFICFYLWVVGGIINQNINSPKSFQDHI